MKIGLMKKIKNNFRKILVFCFIAIFLLLGWRIFLKDRAKGYREISIEDGTGTFTATIPSINTIVVNNNDLKISQELEDDGASVYLYIMGTDGNVLLESGMDNLKIHTNGFTYVPNSSFSNLPFALEEGKSYKITYTAFLQDGTKVDHLSFLLYGDSYDINRISFALVLMLIISLGIAIFGGLKKSVYFKTVFVLEAVIFLFLMPKLQTNLETESFSKAYATSSVILSKEYKGNDGHVLIDESGIRNNGYMSYDVPICRFWKDRNFGQVSKDNQQSHSEIKESTVYTITGNKWISDVFQIPSVLAVSLMRILKMPYQMIFACGWIVNFLMFFIFLSIILKKYENNVEIVDFVKVFALLPSVIISAFSFSGRGLLIITCLWICLKTYKTADDNKRRILIAVNVFIVLIRSIYIGNAFTFNAQNFPQKIDVFLHDIVLYDGNERDNLIFIMYVMLLCAVVSFIRISKSFAIRDTNGNRQQLTSRVITKIISFVILSVMVIVFEGSLVSGVSLIPVLFASFALAAYNSKGLCFINQGHKEKNILAIKNNPNISDKNSKGKHQNTDLRNRGLSYNNEVFSNKILILAAAMSILIAADGLYCL